MNLKKEIKKVFLPTTITDLGAEKLAKLADNYAIKVLEYYHNNLFFIPLKKGEAKKILTYIKKEKNL
jgi:hypothetical protein